MGFPLVRPLTRLDTLVAYHFGFATGDEILIGNDLDNPTYITGLVPTGAYAGFELFDSNKGAVVNTSPFNMNSMVGTFSLQLNNISGGTGDVYMWSEYSDDDGITFTPNTNSLRTFEVTNQADFSDTKVSGVAEWPVGRVIRFALANVGGGNIILTPPSGIVNGNQTVNGYSFFWELVAR